MLLDTATPVWKSKGRDYVLVDGKGEKIYIYTAKSASGVTPTP